MQVYPGLSAALGEEITPDTPLHRLRAIADARGIEYEPTLDRPAAGAGAVRRDRRAHPGAAHLRPPLPGDSPAAGPQPSRRPEARGGLDLIVGGVERGTGFPRADRPGDSARAAGARSLKAAAGDPEVMQLDEDFLRALEFGAPPMGGMGLG